jgi:TrmH family RNA methyltransferase
MPPHATRRLTSRQNPIVARARQLARGGEGSDDYALIEGATLAVEAHAAGWTLDVIAVTEDTLQDPAIEALVAGASEASDVVVVTRAVMDALSPVAAPSGLTAIARLPPRPTLAELMLPHALIVCAVDVQHPGNLGAIVRVAEAAAATGVIAAGASADPFGWKALRGASGSAFRLPLVRHSDIHEVVEAARHAGLQLVASTMDGDGPERVDLRAPTVLFVGSEGSGLAPAVVDACARQITVPMRQPVESLNVAVATAVILYEARRQRSHAI